MKTPTSINTPPGWLTEYRDVDTWENRIPVNVCPHCGWATREKIDNVFVFCPLCGERVLY